MDWTNTKTILIIALIITNSILGLYLYTQKEQVTLGWTEDKEAMEDIIEVLRSRDIFVDDQLDIKSEKHTDMEVAYQIFNMEEESKRFFGNTYMTEEISVSRGQESIETVDKTLLIYANDSLIEEALEIRDEDAKKMGNEFLIDVGFWTEDVYLAGTKKDFKGYELTYKQQHKDKFIENSYMRIRIVNGGIKELERKWFNIIREDDIPVEIIPPSKAMFHLIEELYEEDPDRRAAVYVQSIDLGYRLDTSIFSSNVYSGEVSPYWRIKTESGNEYFIKALKK